MNTANASAAQAISPALEILDKLLPGDRYEAERKRAWDALRELEKPVTLDSNWDAFCGVCKATSDHPQIAADRYRCPVCGGEYGLDAVQVAPS